MLNHIQYYAVNCMYIYTVQYGTVHAIHCTVNTQSTVGDWPVAGVVPGKLLCTAGYNSN